MATKVKVRIDTEEHRINLPALPLSMVSMIAKIALRFSVVEKADNTEVDVRQLLMFATEFINQAKRELKNMEPFVLVEVQDEDNYILVEMR